MKIVSPAAQEIYEKLGVNEQNGKKLDTTLTAFKNHFKANERPLITDHIANMAMKQ